ncbi:MAG: DUF2855 family protein [Candidatus Binatia bacterium]
MSEAVDFVVKRNDLRQSEVVPGQHSPATALQPGQVLLRIERFAFTANNVTYGAIGDMIGYWNFFPARDGWGRLPVWGFGAVVQSRHDGLPVGERVFGYFPMSTYLIVQADHVTPAGFLDAAAHRAALPPIYNQYTRLAADPAYQRARDPQLALFRPLFTTAFLLDDFLAEQRFFGATLVVLSSASSKTALGLAECLRARCADGIQVVGLTSAGNAGFVRGTGYYDRVVTYDEIGTLPRDTTAVLVDFAGNPKVLQAVHGHFDARLAYSCQVGLTHWDRFAPGVALPGPTPILFFAPDQAGKRVAEWGAAEFQRRVGAAMARFIGTTNAWLHVVEGRGAEAVNAVYRAMLDGTATPADGHILSLS